MPRIIRHHSYGGLAKYNLPRGVEVTIDATVVPRDGYVVCADVDGERLLGVLRVLERAKDGTITRAALVPHNPVFPTYEVTGDKILGVATKIRPLESGTAGCH